MIESGRRVKKEQFFIHDFHENLRITPITPSNDDFQYVQIRVWMSSESVLMSNFLSLGAAPLFLQVLNDHISAYSTRALGVANNEEL